MGGKGLACSWLTPATSVLARPSVTKRPVEVRCTFVPLHLSHVRPPSSFLTRSFRTSPHAHSARSHSFGDSRAPCCSAPFRSQSTRRLTLADPVRAHGPFSLRRSRPPLVIHRLHPPRARTRYKPRLRPCSGVPIPLSPLPRSHARRRQEDLQAHRGGLRRRYLRRHPPGLGSRGRPKPRPTCSSLPSSLAGFAPMLILPIGRGLHLRPLPRLRLDHPL